MGEHIKSLILDSRQREALERMARKASAPQALVLRIRIILMTAAGKGANEIASALKTTRATVRKWKFRFLKQGVQGLTDLKRPGAPAKHPLEEREKVLDAACGMSQGPRPSIRSIARALNVDRGFVERVLYSERALRKVV